MKYQLKGTDGEWKEEGEKEKTRGAEDSRQSRQG